VEVPRGADQTFEIAPVTGGHVTDVLVDRVSIRAVTRYTFEHVTADHTLEARFFTPFAVPLAGNRWLLGFMLLMLAGIALGRVVNDARA